MYKCDKCICVNCKNYCGISIITSDKALNSECDDFEPYEKNN